MYTSASTAINVYPVPCDLNQPSPNPRAANREPVRRSFGTGRTERTNNAHDFRFICFEIWKTFYF